MKLSKNKVIPLTIIVIVIIAVLVWYFAIFSIKSELSSSDEAATNSANEQDKEPASQSKYATLTGDAFDEVFIADMLAHHEGAVNMSEQAQSTTSHEEIRTLAGNIVQTQSVEIGQMRQWQDEWGYDATMSGGHMSHGGSGMETSGDMVEMQNKLNGLSGEAYDKEFLVQMSIHHQQAIEMSQFAEKNAKHQEIKELALNIMSTQTTEINQMKEWQKLWGYK